MELVGNVLFNKKIVVVLCVIAIVLLFPAIVHNNNREPLTVGDFKNDVIRAEQTQVGGDVHDPSNHYLGRTIMAYTVGGISTVTGISCKDIQLWIDCLILVGAFLSIYVVVGKLFGSISGLITGLISFFTVRSLLILFVNGDVWNIIEVCIVLIPLLYFTVKWLIGRKLKDLIPMLVLVCVFSSIHPMALLLVYVYGLFFSVYCVYLIKRKEYELLISTIIIYVVIAIINLLLSMLFINGALELHKETITGLIPDSILHNPIARYASKTPLDFLTVVSEYITFPMIGVLVITIYAWIREKLWFDNIKQVLFIGAIGCFVLAFMFGALSKFNLEPLRHAMDAGTFIAIGTGCMLEKIFTKRKMFAYTIVIICAIAVGIAPTIMQWFTGTSK